MNFRWIFYCLMIASMTTMLDVGEVDVEAPPRGIEL